MNETIHRFCPMLTNWPAPRELRMRKSSEEVVAWASLNQRVPHMKPKLLPTTVEATAVAMCEARLLKLESGRPRKKNCPRLLRIGYYRRRMVIHSQRLR